jgi:hypothetical protein
MGNKPVFAAAGALLAGVVLSGCESGRAFYDGPRSYVPPSGGMAYQQGPTWYNQPRMAAAPTSPAPAMSMKPEASVEQASGPLQVTSSLQMVSGSSGSPNPTPMLTVTLPAVKFLVPINGTYSVTPPQGPAQAIASSADAGLAAHRGAGALENPMGRANPPAAASAIPYTPPTIQYLVPTTAGTPGQLPNMAAQAQPMAPSIQYVPVPVQSMGTKTTEEAMPARSASMVPPPSWPRLAGDGAENAVPDLPLPPPPMRRSAPAAAGANSYDP